MAYTTPSSSYSPHEYGQPDFYQPPSFPVDMNAMTYSHVNPSPHFEAAPRYLGHSYEQSSPHQEFNFDESSYTTCSDSSSSARGRSGSNGSTLNSEHFPTSSPTSPIVTFSINEMRRRYPAAYGNESVCLQEISPLNHVQAETVSERPSNGDNASSEKALTKDHLCCPHKDCTGEDGRPLKSFSRKADINRHYKSSHDITYQDCPRKNCSRKGTNGFTRRDHLMEHLRGFHMEAIEKRSPGNKKKPDEKKNAISGRPSRRPKKAITRNVHRDLPSLSNARDLVKQEQMLTKQGCDCPAGDGPDESSNKNHELHPDASCIKSTKITRESNTQGHWVTDAFYIRDQAQNMQQAQVKQLSLPGQVNSEAPTSSPVYAGQPISQAYDTFHQRQMTHFVAAGSGNGFHHFSTIQR